MAGLVPAIPIVLATQCAKNRDARDKRGHDVAGVVHANWELLQSCRFVAGCPVSHSVGILASLMTSAHFATSPGKVAEISAGVLSAIGMP